MDKKHGNNPQDGNKQQNKAGSHNQHAQKTTSNTGSQAHKGSKTVKLGSTPGPEDALIQAISIAGFSPPTPPRQFWLTGLTNTKGALIAYALTKGLTVNALDGLDPANGPCTAQLNADFQTLNKSMELGGAGVWSTVFGIYFFMLSAWAGDASKQQNIQYTVNNMSNQLQYLSQAAPAVKAFINSAKSSNAPVTKQSIAAAQSSLGQVQLPSWVNQQKAA